MRKTYAASKGGLLKQQGVDFGEEPVPVPVAALPAATPRREAAPVPTDPAGEHLEGDPQVHLHRAEDGSVRAITVRCPCGREITMQCEYIDEGGNNEP